MIGKRPLWEQQSAVIGLRTYFNTQTSHLPLRQRSGTTLPPGQVPKPPNP